MVFASRSIRWIMLSSGLAFFSSVKPLSRMASSNASRTSSAGGEGIGVSSSTIDPIRRVLRARTRRAAASYFASSRVSTAPESSASSSDSRAASVMRRSGPDPVMSATVNHCCCASGSVSSSIAPRPPAITNRPADAPRSFAIRSGNPSASTAAAELPPSALPPAAFAQRAASSRIAFARCPFSLRNRTNRSSRSTERPPRSRSLITAAISDASFASPCSAARKTISASRGGKARSPMRLPSDVSSPSAPIAPPFVRILRACRHAASRGGFSQRRSAGDFAPQRAISSASPVRSALSISGEGEAAKPRISASRHRR